MIISFFNKKYYLLIICIFFTIPNDAVGNNVSSSIIPSIRVFEKPQNSLNTLLKEENVKELLLAISIRPMLRTQHKSSSLKTSEILKKEEIKLKKKKNVRVYIMGNTVPIFKSVIPKIWPL